MLVVSPVAYLNVAVLKILEVGDSKLAAVSYYFCTGIILYALRSLALCEDKYILKIIDLCLVLIVNLG